MNLYTVNIQEEIKKIEKKIFWPVFLPPTPFAELKLNLERNSVSLFFLHT